MPQEETDGSLDPLTVLQCLYAGYRALRSVLGIETEEFEDLPADHQEAWMAAMNAGSAMILDSEEKNGVKWQDIAGVMYAHYHTAAGHEDAPKFLEQPMSLRLLWEALARNLTNMIAFDTDEEKHPEPHIDQIAAWYEAKCSEIGEAVAA